MDDQVLPHNCFFWTKISASHRSDERELRVVIVEKVHIALMHPMAAMMEKCSSNVFKSSLMRSNIFSHKFAYPISDHFIQKLDQWACTECGKTSATMNKCPVCYTRFCSRKCSKASWKKTHKVECPLIRAAYDLALAVRSNKNKEGEEDSTLEPFQANYIKYGMISGTSYATIRSVILTQRPQGRSSEQWSTLIDQHQKRFSTEAYLLTRQIQPISEPGSLLQADFLMTNILRDNDLSQGIPASRRATYTIREELLMLYFIDLVVHRKLCNLARVHLPALQPFTPCDSISPAIIRGIQNNKLTPLWERYPNIPRALNGSRLVYTKHLSPQGLVYEISAGDDGEST